MRVSGMPKDDDIGPIPPISARREPASRGAAVPRSRAQGRGSAPRGRGERAGPGGLFSAVLGLALLAALSACVWAWQLQERLTETGHVMQRYAGRIADLEDRLADTDEGMSQNATLQAAKIRELDSEVRKLWDNVWKRAKERLGKLEAGQKRLGGALAANGQGLAAMREDLARLQETTGAMEGLIASSRRRQAEVERVADTLNAINLELARLNKRVADNEEWIGAINAFRKATNASIAELQASLRALQTAPTGG